MEKINTPLGDLLEIFIGWELEIEGNEKPEDIMASVISMVESKISQEREAIEKAYEAGCDSQPICVANGKDKICACTNEAHCQHKYFPNSEDYYNQTFKN